jgi:hypothetical protein
MAGATQRPKLGNVTVTTVKRREQARQICARLEASGIKCFLNDERGAALGAMKARLGGINVQVDRSDVARALQLLQRKDEASGAVSLKEHVPRRRFHLHLGIDRRMETLLQVIVILALAVFMAVIFFY